jgi:CIC family chloride channel protein
VLENDFQKVKVDGKLSDLVKAISLSKRNLFPVVNDEEELVGVINMDDVRDIIFNKELYDKVTVLEIMQTPPAIIDKDDNMGKVLETFEETGSWNLPITYQNKYIGFISRSKIFTSYRNLLKEFSDD